MTDFYEEMCREATGVPAHWKFFDSPKIEQSIWDKMIELMGEGEYTVMIMFSGDFVMEGNKPKPCKPWSRGTLFISPEALQRVIDYYDV